MTRFRIRVDVVGSSGYVTTTLDAANEEDACNEVLRRYAASGVNHRGIVGRAGVECELCGNLIPPGYAFAWNENCPNCGATPYDRAHREEST